MTRDTEDVVARVAAAIREALNEQGGSCADALQDGQVVPDTAIYWFYGHQVDVPALARAALEASDRQSLSDRIDVLTQALNVFVRSAYPVATEINERGHNWCEAYLDEALTIVRAALHQEGIAP